MSHYLFHGLPSRTSVKVEGIEGIGGKEALEALCLSKRRSFPQLHTKQENPRHNAVVQRLSDVGSSGSRLAILNVGCDSVAACSKLRSTA